MGGELHFFIAFWLANSDGFYVPWTSSADGAIAYLVISLLPLTPLCIGKDRRSKKKSANSVDSNRTYWGYKVSVLASMVVYGGLQFLAALWLVKFNVFYYYTNSVEKAAAPYHFARSITNVTLLNSLEENGRKNKVLPNSVDYWNPIRLWLYYTSEIEVHWP